jgi:hypothetical protein
MGCTNGAIGWYRHWNAINTIRCYLLAPMAWMASSPNSNSILHLCCYIISATELTCNKCSASIRKSCHCKMEDARTCLAESWELACPESPVFCCRYYEHFTGKEGQTQNKFNGLSSCMNVLNLRVFARDRCKFWRKLFEVF